MKEQLINILMDAIEEQSLYLDEAIDLSLGGDAKLYSTEDGQLDSLSLVSIIADVERQLFAQFGVKLKLASERDLSIIDSPFNSFGNMIDFIEDKVSREIQLQSSVA